MKRAIREDQKFVNYKKKKDKPLMVAFCVALGAFWVSGVIAGMVIQDANATGEWKSETTQSECAKYNPDTQQFEGLRE